MDSHELPGRVRPITGAAKMSRQAVGATPRDGDLLVAGESTSGRYTICQLPAAVQISASSRNEAVEVARRFAQKHTVDIWCQDNDSLRLLEAYRVESSARPAQFSGEE